jgi:flagellar biosynthesis protein FliQ
MYALITDTDIMHLALQTMLVALKLSAPILVTALVIGFAVSLFQSITQIQEFTLSFVPKVIGIGIALLISGNWMLHTMIAFTTNLYEAIPGYLVH